MMTSDLIGRDELEELEVLASDKLGHSKRLLLLDRSGANFRSAPVEHFGSNLADLHAHTHSISSLLGFNQAGLQKRHAQLFLIRDTDTLQLGLVPEADEPLQLIEGKDRRGLPLLVLHYCVTNHQSAGLKQGVIAILKVGNLMGDGEDLNCEAAAVRLAWWLEELEALGGPEHLNLDISLARLGRID